MKRIILGLFFVMLLMGVAVADIFNPYEPDNVYTVTPQLVRVGISDNSFSNYLFDKVSFMGKYTVTDNKTGEINFAENEVATITYKDGVFSVLKNENSVFKTNNKIYIIPTDGKPIGIVGLKRKAKQALYAGNFELEVSKTKPDKFAIVNVLPLQTYLKGVVPNEMPVSFGLEALKAQAVLARNYVLKPREKYYKEFDICNSVACQVYFGANTQEHLANKAVDETENIVVLYDNDLILAVYSSTSGGYTENYKNVFMQNMGGRIMSPHVPYLVGVPDVEILPLDVEERAKAFYFSKPETFDNASPYFRWTAQWSVEDLEKTLLKTLPTVKNTGFVRTKKDVDYTNPNFLGRIKSIYINKRGVSGKVVALTVITDKNEFTIYKELIIRKVFQYNNKILPSANVFFDFVDKDGIKTVVATGGGFGHGVGMSQWGAGSMAKKGYKFEDIIHHYYTDVDLAVLPFVVDAKKPLTARFYTNDKKCLLKVENNVQNLDLNIIINNKYVDLNTKRQLTKDKKVDISHYLRKGENIITYEMGADSHAQKIKIWLEIEK